MSMEVSSILVAAHELKAPLSVMRQLALVLEEQSGSATQLSLCQQMVSVSERALRQVNDLAKIARLDDGLFKTEPVSARGVCETVLHDLAPLFQSENRQIISHYHNKSRLVVANRDLLHSIIYNFCVNALHYSAAETTGQLSIGEFRGKVRINVRDYGPALPTPIWRSLQSGFVEQPTSIAMRPDSSGLGLYIASQFARFMRARLGAIRHRDGTSFFIELPISHQATLW